MIHDPHTLTQVLSEVEDASDPLIESSGTQSSEEAAIKVVRGQTPPTETRENECFRDHHRGPAGGLRVPADVLPHILLEQRHAEVSNANSTWE